jgi:dihydropyrimidinase
MGSRFDLVVRGARLGAGAALADIGIADGRIRAIADRLDDADRLFDAGGRLVLPGGVDAHCHMDQPSYGAACADDFQSGTVSAACGGTTTIIPFAMAGPQDPLPETVAAYRRRAHGKALIDFAIHPTVQAVTADLLDRDLPALIQAGYASLKVFTTYGGFHLDDAAIRDLVARGCHAPRYHAVARPSLAEREAIHRIAALAEVAGAEVLIVHVSSREGLDEVARAQRRGLRIHAETCPHYLVLDETALDREGLEGAKFLCSPPLRQKADQAALWAGMANGLVGIYASDHSPYRLAGADGKLRHGPGSRFDQIANGLPGLELRLPLLFSEGYLTGRIDLAQFVALSAGTPAALHGIAPRKGAIAVGADADLVVWDEDREVTVSRSMLHDGVDYTPYEGWRVKGWPVTTIARGEVIVDDGRILGAPGRGRFVPCRPRAAPSAQHRTAGPS